MEALNQGTREGHGRKISKITENLVDPRAVGNDKYDDSEKNKPTETLQTHSDLGVHGPSFGDQSDDFKQGDIESLEKLFGKI